MKAIIHKNLGVFQSKTENSWIVAERNQITGIEFVLGRFDTREAAEAYHGHLQKMTHVC